MEWGITGACFAVVLLLVAAVQREQQVSARLDAANRYIKSDKFWQGDSRTIGQRMKSAGPWLEATEVASRIGWGLLAFSVIVIGLGHWLKF